MVDASSSTKIKPKVLLNLIGLMLHLGGTPLSAMGRGLSGKAPLPNNYVVYCKYAGILLYYNKGDMAKIKENVFKAYSSNKVSRPGVHSKTKTSKLKSSKNYKKSNRGQGR